MKHTQTHINTHTCDQAGSGRPIFSSEESGQEARTTIDRDFVSENATFFDTHSCDSTESQTRTIHNGAAKPQANHSCVEETKISSKVDFGLSMNAKGGLTTSFTLSKINVVAWVNGGRWVWVAGVTVDGGWQVWMVDGG
jgi:hypothetical protein